MSRQARHSFPFSAVVGQETLKLALLLVAVDPGIGGVLISGHKGTAKSTAVRALPALLPDIEVVDGCAFGCDPAKPATWCDECVERADKGPLPAKARPPALVELPVAATEDRLLGTLDLEHALREGRKRFEPGLLARANRGILYVDEVNLLDDHLVDSLLDVAASGVNTVEREGVAVAHPARFVLVGTMNPEEGEIRPQLLDRFGLSVTIAGIPDPALRVQIVRRRAAFEADPSAFAAEWAPEEAAVAQHIRAARIATADVEIPEAVLYLIASVCGEFGVEGHRADITLARASATHAALREAREVTEEDVRAVAPLVLAHRAPRRRVADAEAGAFAAVIAASKAAVDPAAGPGGTTAGEGVDALASQPTGSDAASTAARVEAAEVTLPRSSTAVRPRQTARGRRDPAKAETARGRYVAASARPPVQSGDVALDATLRAAAAGATEVSAVEMESPDISVQAGSGEASAAEETSKTPIIEVKRSDLRSKVRSRRRSACVLLCVDASGSMGASARMEAAKGAVMELLGDAYQHRDRVGLVTFRGDRAELVLAPTSSVELARMRLAAVRTGGATPLAHGMSTSVDALAREARRDPEVALWLVIVTDGRANVGIGGAPDADARAMAFRAREQGICTLVLDTGASETARGLAEAANGMYVRLDVADAQRLAATIKGRVG